MSMRKRVCKLLLEGDSYFNGKDVNTNEFNKHSTIKAYCRNDDCKTNEERINALTVYIFKEFKGKISRKTKYNDYDECFLMWLSDKLYKMHIESIGQKYENNYMDGTTLNQAYEKYLKNHKVKFGYWDLFDMIKGLKEANLKYMSEFYKLLNKICKIITDYNNGAQTKQLSKYSVDSRRQYRTLYMNISECKSYLNLLNKLKGIYDDFSSAIKKTGSNNELATKLKKFTLEDGTEMDAVRSFKTYNFSNSKCKGKVKKKTEPQKTGKSSLQPPNQLKDSKHETPSTQKPETKEPKLQSSPEPASPSPQESQPETQQSSSATPSEDPPAKLELPSSSLQESQKPGKNYQNEPKDLGKGGGGPKIEIKGPDVEKGNMNGGNKEPGTPSGEKCSQVNGNDRANSESCGADTEKSGPEGGSADKVSETGDPGNGKGASKGGTDDVSGGDQGSPDGGTGGGPGSDQIDQGSPEGGTTDTKSVQDGVSDDQI
ncbi:CIR protein, partial [Plasmodium chabaudi adami]